MSKRLLKNTVVSAAAFGISGVIGLLLVPILVTAYGLAAYGLLAVARSLVPGSMLAAFDPGLSEQATRAIARARVDHDWNQAAATITTLLFMGLCIGLCLAFVLVLLAMPLAVWMRSGPLVEPASHLLMATGLASLVLFPGLIVDGIIKGLEEFSVLRAVEISSTLLYASVAAALAFNTVAFEYVGYVFLLSLVLRTTSLAGIAWCKSRRAGLKFGRATQPELRRALRYGMHLGFGKVLTAVRDHVTLPLISALLGPAAVGIYDVLTRIPRFVKVALATINLAVLPVAVRLDHANNEKNLQHLAVTGITLAAGITLPLCTTLALFSDGLLRFWIGVEYLPYAFWQALLFIVPATNTLLSFISTVVLSRESALRRINRYVFMQLILFFGLAIGTSHVLHERSFILALALSSLVIFPAQMASIAAELNMRAQQFASLWRMGLICGVSGVAVELLGLNHAGHTWPVWVSMAALCGALMTLACLWAFPRELRSRIFQFLFKALPNK